MFLIAIAFLSGILLLQQYAFLPDQHWVIILLCISCITIILLKRLIWPVAFILGFIWAIWFSHQQSSWILPKNLESKPMFITGVIASIPDTSNQRTSFLFKPNDELKHLIRLSWRSDNLNLLVGDTWRLPVKLKRIHGTMNPGGFDAEAWNLQQGIRATGYVFINKMQPQKLHVTDKKFLMDRIRQYFRDNILKLLPPSKTSPWIIALAIGERKGIDASSWQVLRNTGTNHLMAIAGLHIGFMSAFIYGIVSFLWRRVPVLVLQMPAQHAASFAALVMAFIYSAMAGFSIPTQRACLMFSLFLMVVLLRRYSNAWHTWSLALIGVLLLNPLSVLSESFWLSFGSVALIIYGMKGRLAPKGFWWKHGRIQWVIAIGLIPLSLWLFKQFSIISLIANSIAIPWVGFLILPFIFLGCFILLFSPSLGGSCLWIADKSLQFLWNILTYLSELSWSSWYQSIPSVWVLMAACVGIIILLIPKGFPGRWFGLCWFMPLYFYQYETPKLGEVRLTLLDVGQGLASVIETKNHVLVFDTGAKFNDNFDMGENVVLPFLRYQGIKKIDRLVISHGDNDHSGGANAILQQLSVAMIKTSVPQRFSHSSYCLRGDAWEWDSVKFEFIYPVYEYLGLGNDSSCVLKITAANQSILLTGDIENIAENYLIRTSADSLKSTVIIAPHHGSKTSGLDNFIEAVHPQIVLFATGYLNQYHFPHASVVTKYHALSAKLFNTKDTGAIQLTLPGKLEPALYRAQQKRYWFNKE